MGRRAKALALAIVLGAVLALCWADHGRPDRLLPWLALLQSCG